MLARFLSQTKASSCETLVTIARGGGAAICSLPRAHRGRIAAHFCPRSAASCQPPSGCRSQRSEAHLRSRGSLNANSAIDGLQVGGEVEVWEHSAFFAGNPPRVPAHPLPLTHGRDPFQPPPHPVPSHRIAPFNVVSAPKSWF
jgi:hypothetical protein